MTPTDDPDIVPLTDTRDDCSSQSLWMPVGYSSNVDFDAAFMPDWLWATPDTLDTDGDPE